MKSNVPLNVSKTSGLSGSVGEGGGGMVNFPQLSSSKRSNLVLWHYLCISDTQIRVIQLFSSRSNCTGNVARELDCLQSVYPTCRADKHCAQRNSAMWNELLCACISNLIRFSCINNKIVLGYLLFSGYWSPSPGGKQPGHDVNHLPLSNVEVKNQWSCKSAPPPLPVCFPGVVRNNCTFRY